jgi:hypothetical protein
MTAKRDLKKLVRARQERTGERYTTALEHVRTPGHPIPVLELVDLSAQARAVGLVGRVGMFSDLAERVDGGVVIERLRQVLEATDGDEATALLRSVLLQGRTPPPPDRPGRAALEGALSFLAHARAGLAGVSEGGRMIAFAVAGPDGPQTVVGVLWTRPTLASVPEPPLFVLRTPEPFLGTETMLAMLLRAGWTSPGSP